MKIILRNIGAVIAGALVGGSINMAIIMISGSIIATPEGADVTTVEGLKASIHLFEPKHYLMPFLAHALGTLIGAMLAAFIAATHKMKFALSIGAFFLLGGIMNTFLLPASTWFIVCDLCLAYIPMAYIGGKLVIKKS